ncbi:MAG TPA: ABC transporter ATP-binding protein [Acidimicrobiales bacterium]|nr:ABC transporter ATP-binding protein [Acidimicrobiales bacterium]
MTALLAIDGLTVGYGPVLALESVRVTVEEGGAVSLLGPNGAGKTTLLRAVSGLLRFHGGRVNAGAISFDGVRIDRLDAADRVRRGIAQVLEGRHVFPELSVDENLKAGQYTNRRSSHPQSQAIRDEVMALFPVLGQRLTQPAGLLSGGEQQMVAIGRALMSSPRLLLLDEPSLGLAPLVVRSIGTALSAINQRGVTILLVEQSTALATSLTSRSYLMETGTIRAEGPTAALLADGAVRAAYLGVQA